MDDTVKNEILVAIGKISVKIDIMQEQVAEIQNEIVKMQKEIEKMKKEIAEIQNKILKMQKNIISLSRSVAVIEQVHGEKLQILLDVVNGHIEKFGEQDKKISKCENKLERQESEIYYLNQKVQGI